MIKTKIFAVARERGMTIAGMARVGKGQYSEQYLRRMSAGLTPVPRASKFQAWAASVLNLPVEELFWEEPAEEPVRAK